MSRLYDALRRAESQFGDTLQPSVESVPPAEMLKNIAETSPEPQAETIRSVPWNVSPSSRLVAVSDPKSLGAEKFRALATRLTSMRSQREMKSLNITSTVINEGKTLVAANLAITLARYAKANVLLIEGDLHRPRLISMLGLGRLEGLGDWWQDSGEELSRYTSQLKDLSLSFLAAGRTCDYPSDLLRSERFAGGMASIADQYDWIIVDSTPLVPVVDANLWNRLVDGTILVVRESVTPVNALKKGLENLDNPKLVGVVLNDAADVISDYERYSYYAK